MENSYIHTDVRCQCRHDFRVPLSLTNTDAVDWKCPFCGYMDQLTSQQVEDLVRQYEFAKSLLNHSLEDIEINISKREL